MVSVVLADGPLAVRLAGLKLQVDCWGNPEQLKVTVGLKLPAGAGLTVSVSWPLWPRFSVRLVALDATV